MSNDIKKVVLAYSGGLDTSVILRWIREQYGAEVIAYTADVGQGEEVEEAKEKALATGAIEAIAEDLREEFVRDFVYPAIRSNVPNLRWANGQILLKWYDNSCILASKQCT